VTGDFLSNAFTDVSGMISGRREGIFDPQ